MSRTIAITPKQHYRAIPCACAYAKCPDWHVSGVADVQGVCFTQAQAEAVAQLLNWLRVGDD